MGTVRLRLLRTQCRRLSGLVLSIALLSLSLATPASAEGPIGEPTAATEESSDSQGIERVGRVGFDLLILRPLGVIATAVSLVGAAVAYPFALPFGGGGHVADYLVRDPIDRTFRQPLGEL
jgi:hypothetical protein